VEAFLHGMKFAVSCEALMDGIFGLCHGMAGTRQNGTAYRPPTTVQARIAGGRSPF